MNPKPEPLTDNAVSQAVTNFDPFSETELWEPPFERWLRLADLCLRNAVVQRHNNSPAAEF
jgi:hypothetical protein